MTKDVQEKEMRSEYRKQAREIIASPERFWKDGDSLKIGFESEVAIHSWDLALHQFEGRRDAIRQEVPDSTDVELGAAQIELRTPPINVLASGGFAAIASLYKESFASLVQATQRHGCSVLRVGANPFLPVKNTPRTHKPKYQLVPDFYNEHRRKDADTLIGLGQDRIDIGDAAVVSLFQSFQVNMEANSFLDACDKMNRSFMVAPYLLACSANSRYLECLDTKMQDLRMIGWEKSHDTRMQDMRVLAWEGSFDVRTREEIKAGQVLRVGLPERYFADMADYLNRAGRFPFILYQPDAALGIAIGMTWLDTRVKFIGDSLVVELRLLPTQPTIEEELVLTLFYIGRVTDSQMRSEALLPIEYVRENRLSAMLYGMHRSMWFLSDSGMLERLKYKVGMRREIKRAKQGLEHVGLLGSLDEQLLQSALRVGSPSDRLARALRGETISHQAMRQALMETKMLT